jgi:hypothetical protein
VDKGPRHRQRPDDSFPTEAAIAALGFLSADRERLSRFLALSGLGPGTLRRAAAEPTFRGAVLDYLVGDEKLLIAFAADRGWRPSDVVAAREALVGPPIPEF